jgi:hypothetical protein
MLWLLELQTYMCPLSISSATILASPLWIHAVVGPRKHVLRGLH